MPLPLSVLCQEMHRDAAVIALPADMMPSCASRNLGGLHIELSADGSKYVLTYAEEAEVDTIIVSADKEAVLEHVFDELTETLAAMRLEPGNLPQDPGRTPTDAEIHAMAIKTQTKIGAAQEALLGQINPEWARHQALQNVKRLKQIDAAFGR